MRETNETLLSNYWSIYGKRDADPQMRKQMFIYTDGQQMETSIGSII